MRDHEKMYEKLVSKVTLHFVWGHLSRKQTVTYFRFLSHGMPELLLDPIPALVLPTDPNPYDDPNNPPLPPDQIPGYCGLQWSPTEVTPEGLKKYTLKDFPSEEAVAEAGFIITHKGQCGSCSTLQDLGVYIGQNLTAPVRR